MGGDGGGVGGGWIGADRIGDRLPPLARRGLAVFDLYDCPPCDADANPDSGVTVADYFLLVRNFGRTDVRDGRYGGDLDNDGAVGVADFAVLAADFGCEAAP